MQENNLEDFILDNYEDDTLNELFLNNVEIIQRWGTIKS